MTHCVKPLRINRRRNSKRIPRSRTQQLPRNRPNKSFHAVRIKWLIFHASTNNQQRNESAMLINRRWFFSVRGSFQSPSDISYTAEMREESVVL